MIILVRNVLLRKKCFFRALPKLHPPPPSPQFGQLLQCFADVEIQDLKVSLGLKILYMLYNILYKYNLKQFKAQIICLLEEIDSFY